MLCWPTGTNFNQKARQPNLRRWSGNSRNWTPVGVVTLQHVAQAVKGWPSNRDEDRREGARFADAVEHVTWRLWRSTARYSEHLMQAHLWEATPWGQVRNILSEPPPHGEVRLCFGAAA